MSFPELVIPETVGQAVEALSVPGRKTLIFGGGTLIQPLITQGMDIYDAVIDLDQLPLNQVRIDHDLVSCGAMVRIGQLAEALPQDYIQAAVAAIGGPAVRNLATVGGNLFAKPPYGDLATLLLALDAEVEVASSKGIHRVSLDEFYLLRDDTEASSTGGVLVTGLRFSVDSTREVLFHKMARKHLNAGAVVTVAISLRFDGNIVREPRVALGGVDYRPIRARSAERVLSSSNLDNAVVESAAQAALQDCHPQTDAYASAWYRQRMVPVQIRRALQSLVSL